VVTGPIYPDKLSGPFSHHINLSRIFGIAYFVKNSSTPCDSIHVEKHFSVLLQLCLYLDMVDGGYYIQYSIMVFSTRCLVLIQCRRECLFHLSSHITSNMTTNDGDVIQKVAKSTSLDTAIVNTTNKDHLPSKHQIKLDDDRIGEYL